MFIATLIIALSFVAMIAMTWAKKVELSTGKNILHISTPERDMRLRTWADAVAYHITHISRKSIVGGFHKIVVGVENLFLSLFVKLGKKFSVVGDVVGGKNIPKNRGSVSFFLKSIEEIKKSR